MNDKDWANQISSIGYRKYPNKRSMKLAEEYYIGKLKPKFNVTDNGIDELFMNMNDPSEETILDRKSFILKFSKLEDNVLNKNIPYKKMTIKEKFINDGWEIIEKSYIDIFDEDILCLDLNKVVFFHENTFFYLEGQELLKNDGGVNTTVKTLKSYFALDVKIPNDNAMHLPLYLMFKSDRETGSHILIPTLSKGIDNYVSNVTINKELDLITVSGDEFILDFRLFNC